MGSESLGASSGPADAFLTPGGQPGHLELAEDGLDGARLERMPGLGQPIPNCLTVCMAPGPQGGQDPLAGLEQGSRGRPIQRIQDDQGGRVGGEFRLAH